jgi:hypothetical protein
MAPLLAGAPDENALDVRLRALALPRTTTTTPLERLAFDRKDG